MLFSGARNGARARPFFYFTDYQESETGERGSRRPLQGSLPRFGWKPEDTADPQAQETFERSKLSWNENFKSRRHAENFGSGTKKLIQLRPQRIRILNDGQMDRMKIRCDEVARWLVMEARAQSASPAIFFKPSAADSVADGRASDFAAFRTGL